MQEDMDRWFGGFGMGTQGEGAGGAQRWAPRVDMWQENDQIVVRADVPGVEPEDLEVYCTDDSLILRGECRTSDEGEEHGYHRRERRYGRFERVLPLPAEVDRQKVQASFRNGVLEVRMPAPENSQQRMQRIPIQGARQMSGAKGGETGTQAPAQPSSDEPSSTPPQSTAEGAPSPVQEKR
jgi:HSP20 family protein